MVVRRSRDCLGCGDDREAERAGFEPATHLAARTRFPVALLRPLGHLSEGQQRSEERSDTLESDSDERAVESWARSEDGPLGTSPESTRDTRGEAVLPPAGTSGGLSARDFIKELAPRKLAVEER